MKNFLAVCGVAVLSMNTPSLADDTPIWKRDMKMREKIMECNDAIIDGPEFAHVKTLHDFLHAYIDYDTDALAAYMMSCARQYSESSQTGDLTMMMYPLMIEDTKNKYRRAIDEIDDVEFPEDRNDWPEDLTHLLDES